MKVLVIGKKNIVVYECVFFTSLIFCVIAIFILPIRTTLIDFFLNFSFAFSVLGVVMMMIINKSNKFMGFKIFPSMILITIIMMFAINMIDLNVK